MRKFKFFLDFDKEEQWLNEMANAGYQLENKGFGYTFRQAEPDDTTIKIDYRQFTKKEDFIDYLTLFEDSGWEHIAGYKGSGTQYFRKVEGNSDEDIFSDKLSKAAKYKRLSDMYIQMAITFIPLFAVLISTDLIDINALFNLKLLYLTEGLWERSGSDFWKAFIFETPFALFRLMSWLFIPAMIITHLYCSFKANKLYEMNK